MRVEVTEEGAHILVMSNGVVVDGRGRSIDETIPLRDGTRISAAGMTHLFRALDNGYVGVLLGDSSMRLGVMEGQTAEIGREPNHPGLAFSGCFAIIS